MAFMGLMFVGVIAVLMGIAALVGLVLLIIGAVANHRDKKSSVQYAAWAAAQPVAVVPYKKKIYPKVLIIIGSVILIPIFLIVFKIWLDLEHNRRASHENFFSALVEGYFDDAERLIKNGACVDCEPSTNADFKVPAEAGERNVLIHFCARTSANHAEYTDTVGFLLDHGADMEWRVWSHPENDPSHDDGIYGAFSGNFRLTDHCGANALMTAAGSGNFETVKLLVERGADVNARDFCGSTPLMYAARSMSGSYAALTAEFLVQNGADVSTADNFGQTVWDYIDYYDADLVYNVLADYR